MERPKLMKNPSTNKYLLWFHCGESQEPETLPG